MVFWTLFKIWHTKDHKNSTIWKNVFFSLSQSKNHQNRLRNHGEIFKKVWFFFYGPVKKSLMYCWYLFKWISAIPDYKESESQILHLSFSDLEDDLFIVYWGARGPGWDVRIRDQIRTEFMRRNPRFSVLDFWFLLKNTEKVEKIAKT